MTVIEKKYVNMVVEQVEADGGTVLLVTKHGSHLYGTNTDTSDTDYRILYKPSLRSIVLDLVRGSYRSGTNLSNTKNSKNDVDVQATDIRKAIKLFAKGDIVMMDLMYAYTNAEAIKFISDEYKEFIDKFIESKRLHPGDMSGVLGYIQMQASKYGIRGTRLGQVLALRDKLIHADNDVLVEDFIQTLDKGIIDGKHITIGNTVVTRKGGVKEEVPALVVLGKVIPSTFTVERLKELVSNLINKYGSRAKMAMENEGIDWKALSHAFRAIHQYKMLISTGKVEFPFSEDVREFLVQVKTGAYDFGSYVKPRLETLLEDLYEKYAARDRVDGEVVEEAILWFYKGGVV